jgi:ATP-dependent DNA helicase RecG
LAVARRRQAAIMAPTEILARQHYEKVRRYLEGSRVRTALLVGGMPAAERERILAELAAGELDLVVGTHALIGEGVRFRHLALTVVDEQHRFGVQQRVGLRAKGHAPHCLVMTATPIPRTLAMTVFGDLDVSIIDELPPGRGRTETHCLMLAEMDRAVADVRERLARGEQAYFVYPLVSDAGQANLTSAERAADELARKHFPAHQVALLHGQMPAAAQQEVMARFAAGDVQVLAASTVVEVGVDVPAATAMVIVHAERFGLAQLHQLRGRIGRGSAEAVCYLVAGGRQTLASERLAVLAGTRDGFKIAEADLRLRGPGELFGTRQHGLPELKVADLVEDFELLRQARRDAFAIVAEDPDLSAPSHHVLREELAKAYGRRLALSAGA